MSTPNMVTNVQSGDWVEIPLPVPASYGDATNTDAGFDLPLNAIIKPQEMYLVIDTADSGETIDVGIGIGAEAGYDYDGFIDGFSLTTTGYYCVADMWTATDGSSQNYISAIYTGILFFAGLAGANGAGTSGLLGMKNYRGDGTCKSLCYTLSSDADTFVGRLIFRMHYLPV